jgi:phosphatidylserine/phosphatidylglycerophosphate/cardiolipin synthase-like enzyme
VSTSTTGTLLDAAEVPIANLRVVVRDESAIFASDLGSSVSQSDGTFTVTYSADLTPELGTRRFGIYVFTPMHRQVTKQVQDDVAAAVLALGPIHIPRADTTGWPVTLPGSTAGLPIRDGNAVLPLIDDEDAWKHVSDSMRGAASSINVMQLEFDMPPAFNAGPNLESPEIVAAFDGLVDSLSPRAVIKTTDFRPERVLIDQAQHGRQVRVMLPTVKINWAIAAVDFLLLLIPAILILASDVGKSWKIFSILFGSTPGGGFSAVNDYFKAAGSTTDVEPFEVTLFNRVHAKLVMVDDMEAIVIGSPFSQSYWDTHAHHVFEPRRGSASGEPVPVHDVSAAVRGPAVKDMHDAFRLHWNLGRPAAQQVAPITPAAAITVPNPGESIASLQLVRTLNGGVFPGLHDGELGILEAYLRAIEMAQTYIYFENQYFTNETIGNALIAALNDHGRPNLQIIILLNVSPDIPLYPVWQSNLIERIRKEAKGNANRVDFFTAWTHDPPIQGGKLNQQNPMIMANYVHTKVGIIDGKWATFGSANLDGASLDYTELIHALQFGDNRNHELNYCIFNDTGFPSTDAIDVLRKALWSEHLGIAATDARLASNPANDAGWLALWKATAESKRAGLATSPATINPALGRVLRYPENAISGVPLLLPWTNPERDFLKSSGINLTNLDLIEQTRAYNFHDGAWQ